MSESKTRKHVIFLGAGASKGSGYPLANELRLRISSKEHFVQEVADYENKHGLKGRPISLEVEASLQRHGGVIDLFRNGGFATLDEFCKLAGGFEFKNEINRLRSLVRGALGLFNPEESFHTSEYYGFVQSLFKEDLMNLREDVSILTYNYDPYLEYLLHRALKHRRKVASKGPDVHSFNAATSGFYMPNNQEWLIQDKQQPSFCVLQLHGSISYAEGFAPVDYGTLFEQRSPLQRQCLFQHAGDITVPPIVFPWEVMTPRGFVERSVFPLQDDLLYTQFRGIWERARREVQAAEKISFVGLSMHPFMLDGFRYLFEGKSGVVELVVANKDNVPFERGRTETHWSHHHHSSAYNISTALRQVAPELKKAGRLAKQSFHADEITIVSDFSGFIQRHMKPVVAGIRV